MKYPIGNLSEYYLIENTEEFDKIEKRFYEITGCRSFGELLSFLDTTPSEFSDMRQRLRIPVEWVRLVFMKTPANPAWLLSGTGERHL